MIKLGSNLSGSLWSYNISKFDAVVDGQNMPGRLGLGLGLRPGRARNGRVFKNMPGRFGMAQG